MKKTFSRMDKPLLIITIAFFLFGLIMILSASSMESLMRYEQSPYYYFYKQTVFIITGLILFLITVKISTKNYQKIYYPIILITIIILGILIIKGYSAKGTVGWFNLGPVSIQPSEFAKIMIILFLASYYDKNKSQLDNHKTLLKPMFYVGIVVLLVLLEPDLGTSVILFLIAFFMFFALPMKKSKKMKYRSIVFLLIVLIALVFIVTKGSFLKSYQISRFNFIKPCNRYQEDSGYQLCNSFIAFTNGGLTGQGIGNSTQKFLYLPESYTDFIFAIVVEEWGMITGIILVLVYLFILYRLFKIARKANNLQNSLIAYGVCIYFFLHISINLVGIMGLAPLTGVPLPFMSYGGSYAWSEMIALGLAQRVSIESNIPKKKKKKQKQKDKD